MSFAAFVAFLLYMVYEQKPALYVSTNDYSTFRIHSKTYNAHTYLI